MVYSLFRYRIALRQALDMKDKRVREDVLIDILHRFAPPLGEQPDLLFLPTSCGWGDPTMQPVQAAGALPAVTLAGGPVRCMAKEDQTAANDEWCASSCTTTPPNCPEELCECTATTQSFVTVTEQAPVPRLGYFAMVASPWGAFPQAKPLIIIWAS